jgi:TPR repeat protein
MAQDEVAPVMNIMDGRVKREFCDTDGHCRGDDYWVIGNVSTKACQELAPNLSGNCKSSYLIAAGVNGGGSMGWYHQYSIYGLFEVDGNKKFIVPLKNFDKQNDALNYLDRADDPNDRDKQVIEVLRSIATEGEPAAQYFLGLNYYDGIIVEQDYKEAEKWYRLAAEQGYADAQYNLGFMYAKGEGVTHDYKEAVKWYRLAAEQGDAKAQYNLGIMYMKAKGVIQDYVRAHMWLNLAASKGSKEGSEYREIVAKKMTPFKISEAQKMAKDCEKKNYKNCE